MLIKSVSVQAFKKTALFIFILICILIIIYFSFFKVIKLESDNNIILNKEISFANNTNEQINNISDSSNSKNSYIKWVDFKVSSEVLSKLAKLDISSHLNNEDVKFNWIELMSYLACKYGGDFSNFKQSDLDKLISDLKSGETIDNLAKGYKLYNYYYESYDAIFHEYIGNYTIQSSDENGNISYQTKYGLKAFLPIAKNYSFNHYKDFGTSRSYGYKRVHLGNDLLR